MEEDIAEKLREENPEQFFILVRMHLSFLIDMNTDENDSPIDKPKPFKWGFSKKSKNGDGSATKHVTGSNKTPEAVILTEETINQIYQLIDVLSEDEYLCQEGIFRRTGSLSRQQQLRRLLSSGGDLSKEEIENASFNAHDMASVLKGVLADTPEPLLLNQQHQAYCHLATTCFDDGQPLTESEPRLIGALRLLLLLLPWSERQLARRLLTLLHKTAARQNNNRMSPSSLATMFTPHLMCPRKLSPESLHTESQSLAPILSFMIRKSPILFTTPPHLATDIAAYLTKKQQRRLLSPNGEDLNESVSERSAASTVFTFVDRQASSAAAPASTDAALAQLYAHIQALPESHNKRRLVKQFNRENGNGTPLQLQRAQKHKSLGESLKKHIFNKSLINRSVKKSLQDQRFPYQPIQTTPIRKVGVGKTASVLNSCNNTPTNYTESLDLATIKTDEKINSKMTLADMPKIKECAIDEIEIAEEVHPDDCLSDSNSVDLDEGINYDPRSRKPVIMNYDPAPSMLPCHDSRHSASCSELSSSDNVYDTSSSSMKNDSDFVSTDGSCSSSFCQIKYKQIGDTRHNCKDNNSSCRSFTNLSDSTISDKKLQLSQQRNDRTQSENESKRRYFEGNCAIDDCINGKESSLTHPFKEYLMCRSVLTSSCIDLSFTSEPEDFRDPTLERVEAMSESKMTESLLYCMNGNRPPDLTNDSEFDCSDRVALLDKTHPTSEFKAVARDSNASYRNRVKSDADIVKKHLLCKTDDVSTDKENMSPALKRSAQGSSNYNVIDREGSDVKKVNISSDASSLNNCNQVDSNTSPVNQDMWDFDKYGPMWETDL